MEASNINVMLLDLTDMYFHNTKILHFTETINGDGILKNT